MITKSTPFQLFRYQLLPINRFLQGNLLTGVGSIDELISRKNDFFYEAIDGTKNFSDSRNNTITKKLYQDDNFFLLKIAHNKSIYTETKDFKDEVIDNWPSILVAIWNHPERQMIAVQKRTTAFTTCESVVKMITNALSPQLSHHHLRAIYEPLFERQKFWSLLHEYKGRIKSVEFEIITPNMANISGSLPDDLKEFAKHTNSTRNKLKIESDPDAPLHLEEHNKVLQGLVAYSSDGGGNIALKIDGVKKTYNTSKTVKEIVLGEMEMHGNAEDIATVIKEFLK
jgi:hypothetical protein